MRRSVVSVWMDELTSSCLVLTTSVRSVLINVRKLAPWKGWGHGLRKSASLVQSPVPPKKGGEKRKKKNTTWRFGKSADEPTE
jgi:hypothetical protein